MAAIGAHHGEVVLGDVGDERCMEFAVLGDTVNVASHLGGLCRQLGVAIIVSDELLGRADITSDDRALEGFVPIEPQYLKQRSDAVQVWILKDVLPA